MRKVVFSMDISRAEAERDRFQTIRRRVSDHREDVVQVMKRQNTFFMIGIKLALLKICIQMKSEMRTLDALDDALAEAVSLYRAVERNLSEVKSVQENPAFEDEGSYGGDQGAPEKKYKRDSSKRDLLNEIVRNYYPDYNDREVENLLSELNKEGCGYVALINTLFIQYLGREERFMEVFGFPMYDNNGELNYDALVTDLYCSKDDPNMGGTTRATREVIWESYLKEHNIDVNVKDVNITAENFERISKNGQIIVGLAPCILYDETGKKVVDIDGGHAMTVTGVTEDGLLRVSSWGKEYYIKPGDAAYSRMQFQQVCY